MWQRFYIKPFEAAIGLFVIVNGILTLFPDSVVKDSLWNIVGNASVIIPVAQILAGLAKLIGIGTGRSNIEAAGLISVAAMFAIRAVGLVADGNVTMSDINALTICFGIIASNMTRLSQILLDIRTVFLR